MTKSLTKRIVVQSNLSEESRTHAKVQQASKPYFLGKGIIGIAEFVDILGIEDTCVSSCCIGDSSLGWRSI